MRRRRRQVTWMPINGGLTATPNVISAGVLQQVNVIANTSATVRGGPIATNIFPILQDAPMDPEEGGNASGQLSRILGQEYILERIVGSVFVGLADFSDPEEPSPRAAVVTCGIFVARAGDADDVGGQDLPLGAGVSTTNDNFGPQNLDTTREPWIWRRTWLLAEGAEQFSGFNSFPAANSAYGSLREGTHIDAKSKRRVGNDERLWFATSTMSISLSDSQDGQIDSFIDVRVLGRIVKAHNKSTF